MNLYEFTMRFFEKKDAHALDEKFRFLSGSQLHRAHRLEQRFPEVVPVIYGYRLPYVDSDSPMQFQCKHAILVLVLLSLFAQ